MGEVSVEVPQMTLASNANEVPGSIPTRLTPAEGPTTNIIPDLLIPISPNVGRVASVKRISLNLSVYSAESGIEKQEVSHNENTTGYKTEAEAQEALEGKGGVPTKEITIVRYTSKNPYERIVMSHFNTRVGTLVTDKITVEVERSQLPYEVTVIAQIMDSRGTALWGASFPVVVTPTSPGAPFTFSGSESATGYLQDYVDLVNPVELRAGETYRLRLSVVVPTSPGLFTNTELSVAVVRRVKEGKGELFAVIVPGTVSLFYEDKQSPISPPQHVG